MAGLFEVSPRAALFAKVFAPTADRYFEFDMTLLLGRPCCQGRLQGFFFFIFGCSRRQALSVRTIAHTFGLFASLQERWSYSGHSGCCFDTVTPLNICTYEIAQFHSNKNHGVGTDQDYPQKFLGYLSPGPRPGWTIFLSASVCAPYPSIISTHPSWAVHISKTEQLSRGMGS